MNRLWPSSLIAFSVILSVEGQSYKIPTDAEAISKVRQQVWGNKLVQCGEIYSIKYKDQFLAMKTQKSGHGEMFLPFSVSKVVLTPADLANGYQYSGTVRLHAVISRRWGNGSWTPWVDGVAFPYNKMVFEVVEKNDRWEIKPVKLDMSSPEGAIYGIGVGLDGATSGAIKDMLPHQCADIPGEAPVPSKPLETTPPDSERPLPVETDMMPTLPAPMDAVVMSAHAAEKKLVYSAPVTYPALAISSRISGEVVFNVLIGEEGNVLSAQLLRGHPLLVNAAKVSVNRNRYAPTIEKGIRRKVWTVCVYKFNLKP